MLNHRRLDPTDPTDAAAVTAVWDAQDEATFGGRFAMPPESLAAWWAPGPYFRIDHLGVFDGEQLVAVVEAFQSLTENTDTVELEFGATPQFARSCADPRVVDVLCAAVEELRAGTGRPGAEMWANLTDRHEPLLPYPAIADRLGLARKVTEVASALDLPADTDLLHRLAATARAKGQQAGYRLISWTGPTPPEFLGSYGRLLHQLIAEDQAFEDVRSEIPQYDENRMIWRDNLDELLQRVRATTVAVSADGELVAATELNWHPAATLAEQGTTVVLPEHRGHRLGMALKVTNLRLMTERAPGVHRVLTWNNHLNEHMLAINTELGFTPVRRTAMFATPDGD